MRKNSSLIIIISIIVVLALVGGVIAYLFVATDVFKSSQELFAKYFVQEIESVKSVLDLETLNTYFDKIYEHVQTLNSNFNLDKIADNTKEFAGAELEEIVVSGLYDAFDEGIDLQQKHLDVAISTMVPLSKTMADQIKDLREWAKIRARKASDITWEDDNSGIRKLELESGAEQ